MWVYDGENWIEEGQSPARGQKPEPRQLPPDEFYPELQIVEVPMTRTDRNYVPPSPFAIPQNIPRRRK